MKVVVPCACGKQVRIDFDLLHRKPHCPYCKRPVTIGAWQRFILRIQALFGVSETSLSSRPSAPVPQIAQASRSASASDVEQLLKTLGAQAWRKERQYPEGTFLLAPTVLAPGATPEAMEANLRQLYAHARRWAPGLTVPYNIPRVRLAQAMSDAGQYSADSDGWVSIDISAEFAAKPQALSVILAHEACHHILDQSGLNDRRDRARNERMTDLAMFVVGFGDIVKAGRTSVMQTPTGYVSTHLGYLEARDYEYAYTWVLEERSSQGLPGAAHARAVGAPAGPRIKLADPHERLMKALSGRVRDPDVRNRLIQTYTAKHPLDSPDQIITRILDDLERDNR